MSRLTGARYWAMVGGLVGAIGLTIYPIIIAPMVDPTPWKKRSSQFREQAQIDQNKIQPGNMKVWTDPFDREGKPGHQQGD